MPTPTVRLARATLLTALSDGLFSSGLAVLFYHSGVGRLWRGVASVLLGRGALDGGTPMVFVGLAMHVGVAFTWSAIFLFGVLRLSWVQRMLASRYGVVKVAALYGPFIWLVMSIIVIPLGLGRAPAPINVRWLVQFLGHIPFVGLPLVAGIGRTAPRAS